MNDEESSNIFRENNSSPKIAGFFPSQEPNIRILF